MNVQAGMPDAGASRSRMSSIIRTIGSRIPVIAEDHVFSGNEHLKLTHPERLILTHLGC
jgi:hypothetical protein